MRGGRVSRFAKWFGIGVLLAFCMLFAFRLFVGASAGAGSLVCGSYSGGEGVVERVARVSDDWSRVELSGTGTTPIYVRTEEVDDFPVGERVSWTGNVQFNSWDAFLMNDVFRPGNWCLYQDAGKYIAHGSRFYPFGREVSVS